MHASKDSMWQEILKNLAKWSGTTDPWCQAKSAGSCTLYQGGLGKVCMSIGWCLDSCTSSAPEPVAKRPIPWYVDGPSSNVIWWSWFPCWCAWCKLAAMPAATAWCTCQTFHGLFWNLWSFLAFHMYHIVVRMSIICSSVVCWLISWARDSCTPSCSLGKSEEHKDGFAENQTALAKVHWKKRWASFSELLQVAHSLLILLECFPALSPMAMALLINLQQKVLRRGESILCFQAFLRMYMAVTLLGPCWGNWTCSWEFRNLKAPCPASIWPCLSIEREQFELG